MATCKDCLHLAMCYLIEHYGEDADVEGVETDCSFFADRSKYVVREKGEWLPCGFGKEIMCSVCRCELYDVWEYRYCPNCGADMRIEEQNRAREVENG